MKSIKKVLFVLSLVATANVFADTFDITQGPYGVVGVGSSPITDSTGTNSGWGGNLGVGYNFNKYIGAEAALNVLGAFGATPETSNSFSLAAIGHIPLYRGLNLYLKAGESYNSVGSSSNSTGPTLNGTDLVTGVGLEFTLNESSMRVGVDHFDLTAGGVPFSSNYVNISFVVPILRGPNSIFGQ